MPNNRLRGELENFIAGMIPLDDRVWPLSEAYIDGIPQRDRKFASKKGTRAKVHAWLAARSDPRPMGLAIRAGDMNVEADNCRKFVAWLRRMFEP